MNGDVVNQNWTDIDSLSDLHENLTLSHILNFIAKNHSLYASSEMLNMTEKLRQVDDGLSSLHFGMNVSDIESSLVENSVDARSDSDTEPLYVLISVTICYLFIFIAGVLGNVITCTVISRNKSMHTATNYYLFNLAISDLILLLSGE